MDPVSGSPNAPTAEPGSAQALPDWDSDDNPYKQRFEAYRPEADRRATKLSEYEQHLEDLRSGDTVRQQAAAAALGIELVADEPDPNEFDDPYEEIRRAQAELDARLTAQEQAAAQREQNDRAKTIEQRLSSLKDLDESDKEMVLARAFANGVGQDGLPDIQAAYDQLAARDAARTQAAMDAWAKGKRPPRGIAPGVTATEQKNLDDMTDDERITWAANKVDYGL